MKKFVITLLAILLIICSLGIIACDDTGNDEGPNNHDNITDGTVGLKYMLSADQTYAILTGREFINNNDIVVSNHYKGVPVKEIYDGVFKECIGLKSVEIPASITSIGDKVFKDCTNLERVSFGEGSKLEKIGEEVFAGCEKLLDIDIPNSVTTIEKSAFSGCAGLLEITIPTSLKNVGEYAFENCAGLTKINYFGTIDQWAMIEFGEYASNPASRIDLYINNELVKNVVLTTATKISTAAFAICYNLESIVIPASVKSIGASAFSSCENLTSVTFEANSQVKSIGSFAFSNCGFDSLEIPSSVTSLGDAVLKGCENLETVTFGENINLSKLPASAFLSCEKLTNITIPNSVKVVGISAFSRCNGLESIQIPSSVTELEQRAFQLCSNLKTVNFGVNSKLEKVGEEAFNECESLESIELPASVKLIDSGAFQYCQNLKTLTFGENSNIKRIGRSAFMGCNKLQYNEYNNALYLGSNENKYLVLVKEKNPSVANCEINSNTKIIYCKAFEYNRNLESIEIPASVVSIGDYAFSECYNLKTLTFGENSKLENIGYKAFYYCTILTSLEFEDTGTWYSTASSSYTGGNKIDLTNPTRNVDYFAKTYSIYYWYKV